MLILIFTQFLSLREKQENRKVLICLPFPSTSSKGFCFFNLTYAQQSYWQKLYIFFISPFQHQIGGSKNWIRLQSLLWAPSHRETPPFHMLNSSRVSKCYQRTSGPLSETPPSADGRTQQTTSGSSRRLFSAADFQAFDSLFTAPPCLSTEPRFFSQAFVSKTSKYHYKFHDWLAGPGSLRQAPYPWTWTRLKEVLPQHRCVQLP